MTTIADGAALRLLVVEDERALADVVRRYFEHHGHAVAVAHDAVRAIESHRRVPVDVALIDLVLEGSSGMTVLRELRQGDTPPECLIVTGKGSIEGAVEAMRVGACDYIAKPFTFEELDAKVALAGQRRRAAAEPSGADVVPLDEVERRHIAAVLARVDWHQGRAAQLLGISAKTLYRKIREYGFRRPGRGDGP